MIKTYKLIIALIILTILGILFVYYEITKYRLTTQLEECKTNLDKITTISDSNNKTIQEVQKVIIRKEKQNIENTINLLKVDIQEYKLSNKYGEEK